MPPVVRVSFLVLLVAALIGCCYGGRADHPYFGEFLGQLHNRTLGITSGKAYLINESFVQIAELSIEPTDLEIIPVFSTDTQVGKIDRVYQEVDVDGRLLLVKRNAKLQNITNARLVIQIPKGSFTAWQFFGLISERRWVYLAAVSLQNRTVPEPFCCLPPLSGWVYNVKSGPIQVLDSKTLRIPNFSFEGQKPPDSWFFAGRGPVDKNNGEKCYVKGRDTENLWCPLREEYDDRDLLIELPRNETIYSIEWLSIYSYEVGVDFGHILFDMPIRRSVPPALPPFEGQPPDAQTNSWPPRVILALPEKDLSKPIDLTFTLGPAGGDKAKANRATCERLTSVWYVQGQMQPNLYVQRGVSYRLKIFGGYENPLYLSSEQSGGWSQKPQSEKLLIRNFAGGQGDAAGELCEWKPINDSRALKPDSFDSFDAYNYFLNLHCANNSVPYVLIWTPGADVPDVVYYASFTQYHFGGKIFVCNAIGGDALKPKCIQ